jgi:hypothetical protein
VRAGRAHRVDDLLEVDGDFGRFQVGVVRGVVDQLRHLVQPQLQANVTVSCVAEAGAYQGLPWISASQTMGQATCQDLWPQE